MKCLQHNVYMFCSGFSMFHTVNYYLVLILPLVMLFWTAKAVVQVFD